MKKLIIVSSITILILGGLAFYWYEWRPASIRKDCYSESREKAKELLKTKSEFPGGSIYKEAVDKGLLRGDDLDNIYKNCLREHGLSN